MNRAIFQRIIAAIACASIAVLGICAPPSASVARAATETKAKSGGQFSANDLPADRDGSVLLTVPALGRYAVSARSSSGVAIQLVDMIAGPGEVAGAAGLRDGRLDALLDKGVYKIRIFGAKGAGGKVRLSAEPFQELQATRETLSAGRDVSSELGDLGQRTYSIEVGRSGRIFVEAQGRSLRDLRLWRPDGGLVDLTPRKSMIEPKAGRAMTRLRLTGAVEPGRYLVTAYGGEPLVWPEGGTAQPFLLRLENAASLAAGVAEGVIGPFGSVRFEAPAGYDTFRLELPQVMAARLEARRGEGPASSATIGKTSREPVAIVSLASNGKDAAIVEITGYEGQAFALRALRQANRYTIDSSGPHLVALDVAGEGADEVPATALLTRSESGTTRVIASDLPRIAAGQAWRRKFNLRGTTSLLFEAASSGPVAIRAQGPKVQAVIEPAFGSAAPRADGRRPMQYDLQAGFYKLSLEPVEGAVGVIDVTLGAPGLVPEPTPPSPARSVISFGEQNLDRNASYLILVNSAPGLSTGPRAIALPADLEKSPVPLWQQASRDIVLPARMPLGGTILAIDGKGASVPVVIGDEKIENDARFATLRIAAAAQPRALGIYFVPDAKTPSAEADGGSQASRERVSTLTGARPFFFDLARDERREFRFDVAQGGLYRVETLGRLQTGLTLGTNLTPRIGEAENNGPGHNALLTAYLRTGSYRVAVSAQESTGHLGLAITPSSLATTAPISGEGSARALLAGGRGAIVPIDIPQDGLYRLDLQGLGREWRARLEDAEGWPLTTPGPLTNLTRRFDKGAYRLVVLPEDVEARMLARLRPIRKQPPLEGHGPHLLPFDKAQKLQWREPPVKGAERAPDVWTFSLRGDADIEIDVSEGMIAELVKNGRESVGKFAAGRKFSGKLGAGDYVVQARSLSHDDRLDYEISLTSQQLQPGAPRFVDLPASLSFATAADGIVDLTSFGDRELAGLLENADGAVVERLEGRADDWNIALSRRLPAGAYTLRLSELKAKPGASESESAESSEASDAATDASPSTEQEAAEAGEPSDPSGVEIRFALPAAAPEAALALAGAKTVSGAGAHEFALPAVPDGSLAIVAAQSARETALSIERRGADGQWRVVGYERGLAPVAAWPADKNDNGALRAVAWTVGGGDAPITIAARAITKTARGLGDVTLDAAPIEGVASKLCAGLVAAPSATLVDVSAPQTLTAGSTPGRLLNATRSGPLAPQSERLWLVSREDCAQPVRVASFEFSGAEVGLALGAGERAVLPLSAPPSRKARLWRARSTFGQPGIDAGRGFAVAPGAALALAGKEAPRLWNASGSEPLRVSVQSVEVEVAAPARADASYAGVIPARTALPVTIGGTGGSLTLELASGLAAFSAPDEARKLAVFADAEAVSRTLDGAPQRLWLVNTGEKPAPARIVLASGRGEALSSDKALKRFYGAAGQFAHTIEGEKGDRLIVAGGDATFVGESGFVARGASIEIDGRGEVIVDHKPGLVALWLERGGNSPWPSPAPRAVAAPQRVALEGLAQSFALEQAAPVVIDVRSSAPAIVAFTQNGKRSIETFPSGVELHRYATPGKATLEIYSPHDGPLAGTLDITSTPVAPVKDGVNDAVTLAAGASALFSFEVKKTSEIGLGLRAEPDRAELRLFDAEGKPLGEGIEQTAKLAPGRYFAEARAPLDTPASIVRLAVIGLTPPPAGPPSEVVAEFLEKAGLKKGKGR